MFHLKGERKGDIKEYVLKYLEFTPHLYEVDRILGCSFILWNAGDEVDNTIEHEPPNSKEREIRL